MLLNMIIRNDLKFALQVKILSFIGFLNDDNEYCPISLQHVDYFKDFIYSMINSI